MTGPAGRLALFATFALVACKGASPPTARDVQVREIDSPAPEGSAQPNLSEGSSGRAYLSWIEPAEGDGHRLRFSVLDDGTWSTPRTIVEDEPLLANWADFPSLVPLEDGGLAAHWPALGTGHGYDARLAVSTDGGATWTDPITLHDDATASEHGFVSLVPLATGGVCAVWLDGREIARSTEGRDGEMALRLATVSTRGSIEHELVLDPRVCECCGTSAAAVGDDLVVLYRDRSDTEIRDIARVVVKLDGEPSATAPSIVHPDQWEIEGCPVNGPVVDAASGAIVAAWFTLADDRPRVQVAFSSDGGSTFGEASVVDGGNALGRVDVILLGDGDALVSWLEDGPDSGEIRARRVTPAGELGSQLTVAKTSSARASGFPRMAHAGSSVLIAWTEVGDTKHVRTAIFEP